METYYSHIKSATSRTIEVLWTPEFWDHYMVHLIYCFLLLLLFYFNPRRSQSKIDLFMRAYKESFYHEEKLKRSLSRRKFIYSLCRNLIFFWVIVGFVFSFIDLPGSATFEKLMSMEDPIIGSNLESPDRVQRVISFVNRACIVVYYLMSEYKINLYCKGLVIVGFVAVLLKQWKIKFESNFAIMLKQIESDKDVFMQRFLKIIGKDFRNSLKSFLMQKNQDKVRQEKKLSNEKQDLEQKVRVLQESLEKEKELKDMYTAFASEIMSFQWCEVCYDGDEIDVISRLASGIEESEVRKSLKLLSCKETEKDIEQSQAEPARSGDKEATGSLRQKKQKKDEKDSGRESKGEKEGKEEQPSSEEPNQRVTSAENESQTNAEQCEDSGKQMPTESGLEEDLKDFKKLSSIDDKTRNGWNLVKERMLKKKAGDSTCQENCLVMFLLLCNRLAASFSFLDMED